MFLKREPRNVAAFFIFEPYLLSDVSLLFCIFTFLFFNFDTFLFDLRFMLFFDTYSILGSDLYSF